MNNYIYIHVCCINNWQDVFNKLMLNIKDSGLYDKINKIKCVVLTQNTSDVSFFNDDKIEIIAVLNDINLYEIPTINYLYEHSLIEDFNVLYIHTKGVKHNNNNINVSDWTDYLTYFNINKHEICINELLTCDTIGVNLQQNPELHYSGNFWWAKSSHIRKLEKCTYNSYVSPEMWIAGKRIGIHSCMWFSNINHYEQRYENAIYIDKPITVQINNVTN